MHSNSEMSEPLSNDNEETASQSSQRSGTSLLERIRAQRNAEAQRQASMEYAGSSHSAPSHEIQVPQYSSNARDDFGNLANLQQDDSNNFFSNAWNNISTSMENGMTSLQQEDVEASDALLAPTAGEREGNYSISGYFLTFVRDVYGLFLRLPLFARVIIVILLLYIALKLL